MCFALPLQGGDHDVFLTEPCVLFCEACVLFGDVLADREQGQCHGLRPQTIKPSGAGFIQFPAQRHIDDGIERLRRSLTAWFIAHQRRERRAVCLF